MLVRSSIPSSAVQSKQHIQTFNSSNTGINDPPPQKTPLLAQSHQYETAYTHTGLIILQDSTIKTKKYQCGTVLSAGYITILLCVFHKMCTIFRPHQMHELCTTMINGPSVASVCHTGDCSRDVAMIQSFLYFCWHAATCFTEVSPNADQFKQHLTALSRRISRQTFRCLRAADFDGKFAVVVTYERHVAKDSTIVANMSNMTQVILRCTYKTSVQFLAWPQ